MLYCGISIGARTRREKSKKLMLVYLLVVVCGYAQEPPVFARVTGTL